MPELTLGIGGRSYRVACEAGQEDRLREAGRLLDTEAASLIASLGPVPEARTLLMAGLMLADRMMTEVAKIEASEKTLRQMRSQLKEAQAGQSRPVAAAPDKTQPGFFEDPGAAAALALLEATAQRLETLAAEIEG